MNWKNILATAVTAYAVVVLAKKFPQYVVTF